MYTVQLAERAAVQSSCPARKPLANTGTLLLLTASSVQPEPFYNNGLYE